MAWFKKRLFRSRNILLILERKFSLEMQSTGAHDSSSDQLYNSVKHHSLATSAPIFEPSQSTATHHIYEFEGDIPSYYASSEPKSRLSYQMLFSKKSPRWEQRKLLRDYEESFDQLRNMKRQSVQYSLGRCCEDRMPDFEDTVGLFKHIDGQHEPANRV